MILVPGSTSLTYVILIHFLFNARGNFKHLSLRPSAELDFESGGASKPDGCEVQLCKTSFMEVLKDET